jgi:hypothetical protein
LIQPAVSEWVGGQGTCVELRGHGASLLSLLVPTVCERPIPAQFFAARIAGEGFLDFRPRDVAVPVHVSVGDGVGNALEAQDPYQPIEDCRRVVSLDGSDYSFCDGFIT